MRKLRSKKERKRRKRIIVTTLLILGLLFSSLIIYKCYIYFDEQGKIENTELSISKKVSVEAIGNSCNVSDGYIKLYIPSEFKKNNSINVSWYDLNYTGIDKRDAAISFLEVDDFKKNIGSINDKKTDFKILERNNIKTGYDLIKYYYDNQEKKVTILTSQDKIKLNRMAIKYIGSLATSLDITLLDGDIKGVLFESEKMYHVVVYFSDYTYVVDFHNEMIDYFDYDMVLKYIRKIEFNE